MLGDLGSQKEDVSSLELELQIGLRCHVSASNQTQVLFKSAKRPYPPTRLSWPLFLLF